MLPPECVDERERFGERFGFDEKAGAIDLPCRILHCVHPLGEGETVLSLLAVSFWLLAFGFLVLSSEFSCSAEKQLLGNASEVSSNLLAGEGAVNSKFLVQ